LTGLDTNVVVRFLTQDDPVQSPKANRIMEGLTQEQPGYISQVVLVEMVWVLTSLYKVGRRKLSAIIASLLGSRELVVESAGTVRAALEVFRSSRASFADCLIERACDAAKCDHTLTFDVRAAKSANMRLIH
jgi:predicted nucleic-acid-binding protein